jgi:hypothetical protein
MDELRNLWAQVGEANTFAAIADQLVLNGNEPTLPSSFRVATAAQASLGAAASAALPVGAARGLPAQRVRIDMAHAAAECNAYFALDGRVPDVWDKYSGVFRASDGWVRIHANFAHHRDAALAVLGLHAGEQTSKDDVTRALQGFSAQDFEDAVTAKGGVVAALRTRAQWLAHAQSRAVGAADLVEI